MNYVTLYRYVLPISISLLLKNINYIINDMFTDSEAFPVVWGEIWMMATSGAPGEAPDGAVMTTMDGITKYVVYMASGTPLLKQQQQQLKQHYLGTEPDEQYCLE